VDKLLNLVTILNKGRGKFNVERDYNAENCYIHQMEWNLYR